MGRIMGHLDVAAVFLSGRRRRRQNDGSLRGRRWKEAALVFFGGFVRPCVQRTETTNKLLVAAAVEHRRFHFLDIRR